MILHQNGPPLTLSVILRAPGAANTSLSISMLNVRALLAQPAPIGVSQGSSVREMEATSDRRLLCSAGCCLSPGELVPIYTSLAGKGFSCFTKGEEEPLPQL